MLIVRKGIHSLRKVSLAFSNNFSKYIIMSSLDNESKSEEKRSTKTKLEDAEIVKEEPSVKLAKTTEEQNERLISKRKKFAILLAYCGAGYYGMQVQPGHPTIEEAVLDSLVKSKLIAGDVLAAPGLSANFQRAARTDKGVSAACQLISLRMADSIEPDNRTPTATDKMVEVVNEHLPEQIKVINIYRVTRSFDSKSFCCARTYCYMLPSYALQDCTEIIEPSGKSAEYRLTQEKIDAVNGFLQNYKGTHNFHNFTSGLAAEDRSANRYMMLLECGKPFVAKDPENPGKCLEFVILSIKGQSFMLHQIRKMIALMVCVVRGTCSLDTLGKAWGPTRVDIPMAPALGLFLNRLHYDGYNKRFGSDGMHLPLDWKDKVEENLESFKSSYIINHIVHREITENSMFSWLETLNRHSFDYRTQERNELLNEDAEPPPETNEGKAAQLVLAVNDVKGQGNCSPK